MAFTCHDREIDAADNIGRAEPFSNVLEFQHRHRHCACSLRLSALAQATVLMGQVRRNKIKPPIVNVAALSQANGWSAASGTVRNDMSGPSAALTVRR